MWTFGLESQAIHFFAENTSSIHNFENVQTKFKGTENLLHLIRFTYECKCICFHNVWLIFAQQKIRTNMTSSSRDDDAISLNLFDCSAVASLDHGTFTKQEGRETLGYFSCGSVVRYKCDSGYHLVGNDTLTCLDTEVWNYSPPTCSQIEEERGECDHIVFP